MGDNVIFFRPVEKVGTIVDVLKSCTHSTFPVVDTEGDENNLFGTISRNEVCALLKSRSFGRPVSKTSSHHSDYIHVNGMSFCCHTSPAALPGILTLWCLYFDTQRPGEKFLPITGWDVVEGSYPKYPKVTDIRIGPRERDLLVDLRPYANTAPVSVQETATVNVSAVYLWKHSIALAQCSSFFSSVHIFQRTYNVFRTLGLRFLPVVNKRKQIVGTITRSDICPEGLSSKMLKRGAKKQA